MEVRSKGDCLGDKGHTQESAMLRSAGRSIAWECAQHLIGLSHNLNSHGIARESGNIWVVRQGSPA